MSEIKKRNKVGIVTSRLTAAFAVLLVLLALFVVALAIVGIRVGTPSRGLSPSFVTAGDSMTRAGMSFDRCITETVTWRRDWQARDRFNQSGGATYFDVKTALCECQRHARRVVVEQTRMKGIDEEAFNQFRRETPLVDRVFERADRFDRACEGGNLPDIEWWWRERR